MLFGGGRGGNITRYMHLQACGINRHADKTLNNAHKSYRNCDFYPLKKEKKGRKIERN
jgi:hypothetical protein